jgi:hypothetical protein
LTNVESKYGVRLPRKVLTADFDAEGDLYVRFKHVDKPIGEASKDGLVVFFYEDRDIIVGLELLDIEPFN